MKCNQCPYADKVHGVIDYFTCSQRGGSRHGHDGCELIEAIKTGNKVKVNNLLHPPQPVDFEEDTVEMEPVKNPHWPYDAEMLPETFDYSRNALEKAIEALPWIEEFSVVEHQEIHAISIMVGKSIPLTLKERCELAQVLYDHKPCGIATIGDSSINYNGMTFAWTSYAPIKLEDVNGTITSW
jgi:hypothetical protein